MRVQQEKRCGAVAIVCLGDSLTYGYGVAAGEGWVERLAAQWQMPVVNAGVPGYTTEDMRRCFAQTVLVLQPAAVYVMGGTNDLFGGEAVDSIMENVAAMTNMARQAAVVPVLLAPPPVWADSPNKTWFTDCDYHHVNRKLLLLEETLQAYGAATHCTVVSTRAALLKLQDEEGYLPDNIHLRSVAYAALAAYIGQSTAHVWRSLAGGGDG